MRRTWPCGHTGKGKQCNRCRQEAAASELLRAEKRAWEESFDGDPIDLRGLPRERVLQARELLRRLAAGEPYVALGGKRRNVDRLMISIPLGQRYRLLARDVDGAVRPVACMTHEAYNDLKPGAFETEARRGC